METNKLGVALSLDAMSIGWEVSIKSYMLQLETCTCSAFLVAYLSAA